MRLNVRLFSKIKQGSPFYITTPIFYVNASPHIGHLYSAILADTVQRFEKLVRPSINVTFSTGTDEHGTKIQQAASKHNMDPNMYCDKISNEYKHLFNEYNVGYTDFFRTTNTNHKLAVQHFWKELKKREMIYKSEYSGWYSVNDESFVPENQLKEEIRNGQNVKISLESGHPVEWTQETNYMFRLSAFKTHLKSWLKKDGVVWPSKFQKQLIEMLDREVYFPDISISRPTSRVHWAIPVPDDPSQSVYVWLDALINYLTVAGYPNVDEMKSKGRIWPADLHVVGKDILKFHAIYWPAFLMAINWHPPKRILCHSHWTVDGSKMSKSLNNVVDPRLLEFPNDAIRYMLLREHTLHSDANYSETKLINTINSELADTLGNLLSRCCGRALNPRQEFPAVNKSELNELKQCDSTVKLMDSLEMLPETCKEYYSTYQIYKAVDAVIQTLHLANSFFEIQKPWELSKKIECQNQLDAILHITLETLRICGIILQPIIPEMSKKLLDKLQIPLKERLWVDCEKVSWRVKDAILENKYILGGKFVLFQRIYVDKKKVKAEV